MNMNMLTIFLGAAALLFGIWMDPKPRNGVIIIPMLIIGILLILHGVLGMVL
jgi:uncharacterized membrane protein HdeD (DUF308 family)